ncbi:MAG: hypothetical protein QNK16_08500 [Woeseiaceae bacterium]|nr:hypothetical protein [Woeseiaceae bacterium]MDX2608407.1 hypothetical protein [Woeseiaceae bacterium]
MTYLLAKYALVFLLSLITGFLFGRWMTRRSFVDVSESYENLRDAATRSDSAQWSTLWSRLDALPEPKEADVSNLANRLDGLAYAVGNLPRKLEALRSDIKEIPAVETHAAVNLTPIDQRLSAIEAELGRLGRRLEVVPPAQKASVEAADTGPATLKTASYGDKDNLRLIFGVGRVLEELLNRHGIFYFWQVANWTDRDIDIMDERLDTFKGRIVRDNWVKQAKKLSRDPNSAQKPTEMRISA